jgi:hypothetical protein
MSAWRWSARQDSNPRPSDPKRDNWEETFSQVVTMLEGIRVDYYGAKPPESALEPFRRAGSEIRIKPTHLAGFTRAGTT